MIAFYLACVLAGIVVGVLIGMQAPAPQFINHEAEANQWANALLMSEFKRIQPKAPRNLDAQFALAICGMSRTATKRASEPLSARASEALRLLGALQIAQENGYALPNVADEASTGIMSQSDYVALIGA